MFFAQPPFAFPASQWYPPLSVPQQQQQQQTQSPAASSQAVSSGTQVPSSPSRRTTTSSGTVTSSPVANRRLASIESVTASSLGKAQTVNLGDISPRSTLLHFPPPMWVLEGFVTPQEAFSLIAMSGARMKPARTFDSNGYDSRRKSSIAVFRVGENPIIEAIAQRIAFFTKTPVERIETPHVVHYQPGDYFVAHHDYITPSGAEHIRSLRYGGQRLYSIVIYLNTIPEGFGARTRFPRLGINVRPVLGRAIVWRNTLDNGKVAPATLHEGEAVKAGCEKYVVVAWVREKPTYLLLNPPAESASVTWTGAGKEGASEEDDE